MIRVMVCEEDVPELRQRYVGEHKLTGDAVAAIDHVRCVVDKYDLSRRRGRLSWPWSAARTEEDQLHLVALPRRWPRPERRPRESRCPEKNLASIDSHTHVSPYRPPLASDQQANALS